MGNAYQILVWKSEAKRPVTQNRVQWQDNVNTTTKSPFLTEACYFSTTWITEIWGNHGGGCLLSPPSGINRPDDGVSNHHRKISKLLPDYTLQQSRLLAQLLQAFPEFNLLFTRECMLILTWYRHFQIFELYHLAKVLLAASDLSFCFTFW